MNSFLLNYDKFAEASEHWLLIYLPCVVSNLADKVCLITGFLTNIFMQFSKPSQNEVIYEVQKEWVDLNAVQDI